MASRVVEIENPKTGEVTEAVYEHPFIVRLCHWVNAISLFVLVGSGLQIFRAFPSFGAKIPQHDLFNWPSVSRHRRMARRRAAMASDLHVDLHRQRTWCTSAINFSAETTNKFYLCRATFPACGRWCGIIFSSGQSRRRKKRITRCRNMPTLRRLGLALLSVLTGVAIWKPVQFSWLAWMMGGFHYARIWHFIIMWALIAFVFGHLVMVVLHGWSNFVSMFTGWKKDPEYKPE